MSDNNGHTDSALARQPTYRNTGLIPFGQEWESMRDMANVLVKSGFLPEALDTAEKALAVLICGRELGIPPMQAIRGIHVVQGKPSLSAELMLALAYQNIPGFRFRVDASNEQLCKVTAQRPGAEAVTISFSMSDAQRAGLTGKDSWKKYPGPLLRARATSAVLRIVAPDAIRGIYTPGELGRDERDVEIDNLAEAKGVALPPVAVQPDPTTVDAQFEEVK